MARFLIVDDDSGSRVLLGHILSAYGQCDLAANGFEAIAAFNLALQEGRPYDLVCLDIMMPEMDGHQVLKTIRHIERAARRLGTDGVKVAMITASEDTRECVQAFNEGCESYLPKPIHKDQLLACIAELLPGIVPAAGGQGAETGGAARRPEDSRERRFLIVDDDRVCRELLGDLLGPHGQCDFAYDGAEAVEAVRLALDDREPYDLICLDIMMPGTDGHSALAAIRRLEAERGIRGSDGAKVVMTTALRDSKHCIQSFREGCECYVTKPVDPDDFFARLRSLDVLPAAAEAIA